ncbi:MAG: hypothetical protein ACI9P5_003743 [Saprospiraceae bacterium]|jgi:hypothetical protein
MKPYLKNITRWERIKFYFFQIVDHLIGRQVGFKLFEKSRRALYNNLHQRLKDGGELGTIHSMDRVDRISIRDFKKNYIKKGIPLIIEGGAKEWLAVKNWSIDYFKELYGEEEILFVDYENHSKFEQLKLKEILDGLEGEKGKYYRFYPLLQRHPEHKKDFDFKWLEACRHKVNWSENLNMFIGAKGHSSPIHNSFSNNIFIQVTGEKEWIIYPPYYSPIFDPDPALNMYRGTSERQGQRFDSFNPDYEKHPLFKYMDAYRVVLKPGDILYNPPYWWHTVVNHSNSIGVGYRWLPPLHSFAQHPVFFTLDLMVRKPPLWQALKLSKEDINLVQLAAIGKLKAYRQAVRLHQK